MKLLFKPYFILCFTLFNLPAQAQPSGEALADSLLHLVRVSKPDSSRVKLYLQLGQYYLDKKGAFQADMDSAFVYASEAEDLSRTLAFAQGHEGSQMAFAHIFLQSKKLRELRVLIEKMKPDKNKADILQRTGRYYLQKPYELPVDLDSATYYAQAALTLQLRLQDSLGHVRSLIMLAHINNERGDLPMKKRYQQKAIPLIEKVKDLNLQAGLWFVLGGSYTKSEESMPDRINHYKKALSLYKQLGNKEREAYTLRWIADMHQYQGDYAQSLRELLEVLRIQKSIGLPELHYTYDLLGQVYARMGNYELALPYALDAIRIARATADTTDLDLFYSLVGQIYLDLNQHVQALEMHRTVLTKLSREPDNRRSQFRLINIRKMSQSLMASKRPQEGLSLIKFFLEKNPPDVLLDEIVAALCLGEAYMGLRDYAQAEKHLAKGLAKATSAKGTAGWVNFYDINADIMLFHANLTNLYLATGQLQKASFHLKENFPLLKKQPDLIKLSNLHLQAFKLDSLSGNLTSAITHYQQYKALQDSVFNERKSNQLIAYQVQYETEKKEQELELKEKDIKLKEQSIQVLTKERILQQEQMKQAKLLRNGIIGGAALLILLLGVIYNRYRLKQQSNKLLQNQQSKLQEQHQELQTQQCTLQEQQQQIQEKNQVLEQLLVEKERLLKEIHHRVKNNLQIVMSLLNSQVASLQDKAALSAIQDSQNRVQTIVLIHQKLYQEEGVARIPMNAYVEEVVAYLQESYALSCHVSFKLLIEPIELDVNLAVPLGLIINEGITNAFKYAFPGEHSGVVRISLRQKADALYELTIEDDGVGLPKAYDISRSRSLGMTLMHGFSAQLGGELRIESSQGVKISLAFTDEKLGLIHKKADYVY